MVRVVFIDGEIKAFNADNYRYFENGERNAIEVVKGDKVVATLFADNVKYLEILKLENNLKIDVNKE